MSWGVLSEDGRVYGVGRWVDGVYMPGSWLRARRECRLLRRDEPGARVVRRQVYLTTSGKPDSVLRMDTYTADLTAAAITAAETTTPGAWSRAPKRKPLTPLMRARRIRALTDLIAVTQNLLDEEIVLARDWSKTAPDLSFTLIGLAAGMSRQAAHEAVTKVAGGARNRRKTLGHMSPESSLLNTDEEADG